MEDPLAAEALRLRTVEQLSAGEIRRRLGIGKTRLAELLRGVPPPEWTKRPNAKDELRARAIELRGAGMSAALTGGGVEGVGSTDGEALG